MIKYFIRPASDWETMKVKMEEALGHGNIKPRYSLDQSQVLLKFNIANLPEGVLAESGFTNEEILIQLDSAEWTDEPSDGNEIEI